MSWVLSTDAIPKSGSGSGAGDGKGDEKRDADRDGDAMPITGAEVPFSEEELFHLLGNERRRMALRCLTDADRAELDLTDLTHRVAAREYEVEPSEVTDDQRQRIYVALYQSHLPKLDEAGVVEFDPETGYVRPTRCSTLLDPYLVPAAELYARLVGDDEGDSDGRRTSYLLVASSFAGALLGGGSLGVVPLVQTVEVLLSLVSVGCGAGAAGRHAFVTGSASRADENV